VTKGKEEGRGGVGAGVKGRGLQWRWWLVVVVSEVAVENGSILLVRQRHPIDSHILPLENPSSSSLGLTLNSRIFYLPNSHSLSYLGQLPFNQNRMKFLQTETKKAPENSL